MEKKFSRSFYLSEFIPLGVGFPVAAGYVLLLLNIEFDHIVKIALFATLMCVLVEIVLAQPMNILVSRKVRLGLRDWDAGRLKSKAARSDLYFRLIRLPQTNAILAFLRIALGSLFSVIYMGSLGISLPLCIISLILSSYGAYLSGVISYSSVNRLVSPLAEKLVALESLDPELVEKRRWFGLSVRTRILLALAVPILVTNLSVVFSVYSSWEAKVSYEILLIHVTGDIFVSILTLVTLLLFSVRMIERPLGHLAEALGALASGKGVSRNRIPTDLADDFSSVTHLMNRALDNFYDVILKLKKAVGPLNQSIQELGVSSQEISATSNQQAAGVKEIVTTMEDSDQLSKKVAAQAGELAKIAEGTKSVVNTGFELIKQSLEKMEAIKESNGQSIQGIRELGDKIANIWDIVNIINGIADQTKIIAFNAELEAASAGEAGRNFQIVATEIRRLADGTVGSTAEIKARINEIQNSSDHLILSSEEGTAKIVAGWELSARLRTLFEDILSTSEISSESAQRIASSANQQVAAFEQILLTLKQISSGIDNFVTSTASTSKLTRILADMSTELDGIVKKYEDREEGEQAFEN